MTAYEMRMSDWSSDVCSSDLLDVPVVHIHGGERSGTVDEPVRHAISKLSHYHFTATQSSSERLCRMGERPETVFTVGAPGLVGLSEAATRSRDEMADRKSTRLNSSH